MQHLCFILFCFVCLFVLQLLHSWHQLCWIHRWLRNQIIFLNAKSVCQLTSIYFYFINEKLLTTTIISVMSLNCNCNFVIKGCNLFNVLMPFTDVFVCIRNCTLGLWEWIYRARQHDTFLVFCIVHGSRWSALHRSECNWFRWALLLWKFVTLKIISLYLEIITNERNLKDFQ